MIIFGAGKIGRSFIGQLFSRGGYEVVFIDINKSIIDELNQKHNYKVIIKGAKEEILIISNVRGLLYENRKSIIDEIATSGIMAISVGLDSVGTTISIIAEGLLKRYTIDPDIPLDIIIAENLRNASHYFYKELKVILPEWFPIETYAGIIETSIGKMVPIMVKKDQDEDLLQVFAESYNTLILDKKGFRNPIPDIKGLAPKEDIKAWVDRKLFIHNLGHASAAYLGYKFNPKFIYIYEALLVPEIFRFVRRTMLQSANLLLIKYPNEFTKSMLTYHIDDLLYRFQNRALCDTIFRVGCDLFRKLSPDDRLAGSIKLAIDLNQSYDRILFILICACTFSATDEEGNLYPKDAEFNRLFQAKIGRILSEVCGFDYQENKKLFNKAEEIERFLQSNDFKTLVHGIKFKNL